MRRAGLWRFKRLLDQQSLGMLEEVWREADLGMAGGAAVPDRWDAASVERGGLRQRARVSACGSGLQRADG